jgi:hypothetical protein
MFTIVSEITGVNLVESKNVFDPINLHQFLEGTLAIEGYINLSKKITKDKKKITSIMTGKYVICHMLGINVENFNECNTIVIKSNNNYSNYKEFINLVTGTDFYQNINIYQIIDDSSFITLNIANGIGLYVIDQNKQDPKIVLFYCDVSVYSEHNIDIKGECYDVNKNTKLEKFDLDYSTRYQKYYYYSQDDHDCGWQNRNFVGKAKYLSSYGSAPRYVSDFLEYVGRYIINLEHDEPVNGEWDSKSKSYTADSSCDL